nr:uncharacterized protein LOC114820925 [Malus domestica]
MVLGGGERLQWTNPSFGVLKLNCDAAWRKETKVGGVGWVLRDFAGLPNLVEGVGGQRFAATIMVEAEAIRQGLEMVISSGVLEPGGSLVVASDSKGLIQMINQELMADVALDIYLQDIWRMANLFQLVRFCFTPRQYNRAAHSVAAHVVKHGGRFGWDLLGLEFLFNILAKDANVTVRI